MIYSKLSNPLQDKTTQAIYLNSDAFHSIENGHFDNMYMKEVPDNSPSMNVYTSYEDLPNFFKDSSDIFSIFRGLQEQMNDDLDWKLQFDVVENLRILNKYYPDEVANCLNQFTSFLQRCIDSLRTNLSKNTLLFIKELFSHFRRINPNEEFLNAVLPRVIEKAISDKVFIKTEATAALKTLSKYGCSNPVVKILAGKSFDKSSYIAEISFQILAETVKEVKGDLTVYLRPEYIELLFHTIVGAIEGKRAVNKRVAEDLCQQLKEGLPTNEEELGVYLKEKVNLKENDVKTLMRAMQVKKAREPKANFSAFLKEKKMKKDVNGDENKSADTNNFF